MVFRERFKILVMEISVANTLAACVDGCENVEAAADISAKSAHTPSHEPAISTAIKTSSILIQNTINTSQDLPKSCVRRPNLLHCGSSPAGLSERICIPSTSTTPLP